MPITSGANGLNLVEASHVLLIEPILNPAQELQAIGRVHRIGQTKPTTVHRFLIRSTIEERMHQMLRYIIYATRLKITLYILVLTRITSLWL
jgi:E3 ubiquitin-protein ligase SHPRH